MLNHKILQLEKELVQNVDSQNTNLFTDTDSQITLVNKEINEIMEKATNSAMLKCKYEYYEGGEKNSKYFFNLAKNRLIKKVIKSLQTP